MPATKKNLTVLTTPEEPTNTEPKGWDPFEVWRTRILLPRLAEAAAEQEKPTAPVQLVRR